MNICVVNGSPKGKYSITLQTLLYIEKYNSEDPFDIIDAGAKYKQFEKDFSDCKRRLEEK